MIRRPRPQPRRGGGLLLALLVVILGLLVAADVMAKRVAEEELATRVHTKAPEASDTSARIRSFPFLARLLFGNVKEVDATVRDVTVEGVRFDFITVQLHGVELDREEFVNRRIVLQGFERGEVRAEVGEDSLAEVLGLPIELEDGRASVVVAGQRLSASLSVEDNQLVVGGIGVSLPALGIQAPLLPCVADAEVREDRVVLTCGFTDIPEELRVEAQL